MCGPTWLQSGMGAGRGSSVHQARAEHRSTLAPRIGCSDASKSENKITFVSHLIMPLHRLHINSLTVKKLSEANKVYRLFFWKPVIIM
jgi:hypothetical protein